MSDYKTQNKIEPVKVKKVPLLGYSIPTSARKFVKTSQSALLWYSILHLNMYPNLTYI